MRKYMKHPQHTDKFSTKVSRVRKWSFPFVGVRSRINIGSRITSHKQMAQLQDRTLVLENHTQELHDNNIRITDELKQISKKCDTLNTHLSSAYKKIMRLEENILHNSVLKHKKVCLASIDETGTDRVNPLNATHVDNEKQSWFTIPDSTE